jgi:TFIIF, beta subunit HTH domain
LETQDSANLPTSSSVIASSNLDSNKKSRQFAPDESVRSVLFALFGMERYWTSKDLKHAAIAGGFDMTKRAETEMRDLLRNELAVYHRSGDHKNQWELKEEFRQDSGSDHANDGAS